jgi:hemerythrin-like domain-containing protein
MPITTANSPTLPRAAASAINRIKAEHRALACMLAAMQALVMRYREPGSKPDYGLFDSMLRYIEIVPDRLHHPKEDQVLFPAVMQHAHDGKALVRELEQDHARGAPMLLELRRASHAFRGGETNALNQLATAIDEFAEFYWWHMRKEEQQLLPLALEHLPDADWQRIDSAFGDNTDPLFGAELTDEYRRLYQHVTELAPRHLRSLLESAALTAS